MPNMLILITKKIYIKADQYQLDKLESAERWT